MSSLAQVEREAAVLPRSIQSAVQQWRRQIACRSRTAAVRGLRPLVLVSYRVRGPVIDELVPAERLTFVSVFDQWTAEERLATCVLGCGAVPTAYGIRIAEPRFVKDLRLPPGHGGRGQKFDSGDRDNLLEAALAWERHLERHARHPYFPRHASVRWTDWWCAVTSYSPGLSTRRYQGRTLAPLEEVLRLHIPCNGLFADLATLPKRQVLNAEAPSRVLCGTAGPVSFDLYHNRFRPAP